MSVCEKVVRGDLAVHGRADTYCLISTSFQRGVKSEFPHLQPFQRFMLGQGKPLKRLRDLSGAYFFPSMNRGANEKPLLFHTRS